MRKCVEARLSLYYIPIKAILRALKVFLFSSLLKQVVLLFLYAGERYETHKNKLVSIFLFYRFLSDNFNDYIVMFTVMFFGCERNLIKI